MIKPCKKRIVSILILVIICILLGFMIIAVNVFSTGGLISVGEIMNPDRLVGDNLKRYESVEKTLDHIAVEMEEVKEDYYTQAQMKANLAATGLLQKVIEQGDGAISKVGKGGVIKIENGEVTVPEGMRTGVVKYAQQIQGARGWIPYETGTRTGVRKDALVYSRIKGPYYYVEVMNGEELVSFIGDHVNFVDLLDSVCMANTVSLVLICPDRENSRYFYNLKGNLVYAYERNHRDPEINAEDLGYVSNLEELKALEQLPGYIDSERNETVRFVVREIPSLDCVAVVKVLYTSQILEIADLSITGVFTILVLNLVFIIWLTSVYDELQRGILTEEKKQKYSPSRVRVIALSYGIISTIAVFALSLYARTLSNLYKETDSLKYSTVILDLSLGSLDVENERREENRRKLYKEYGDRISDLIEANPGLKNKEDFKSISKIIGSEYIMLFDSEGKQVCTGADYINMELGPVGNNSTSTTDFRRILKGVPCIAHSKFKDEVTGKTLELIGVRTNDTEKGGYGVLLMAFKPEDTVGQYDKDVDNIMASLCSAGRICFSIEKESYTVENTGTPEVERYDEAEYIGLKRSMLRGDVADFAHIAGADCYVVSQDDHENNRIFYFCCMNSTLFENGFRFAITCAIANMILFVLLCSYLLFGYTDREIKRIVDRQAEEQASAEKRASEDVKELEETSETEKTSEEAPEGSIFSRLVDRIRLAVSNLSPEQKALGAFRILIAIAVLHTIPRYRYAKTQMMTGGSSVVNYILSGSWNRGINLFSLSAMIFLLVAILIGMTIIRFILNTIGKMLNPRGQTICRLVANLFMYASIIIFFYYALSYIGVDTNAILASVGVLSIGISMGARDLIADVFAGVSTIFEGEYQVGDIVNIDGYRGMVQDIGVRSTKLIGRGGNIRVFGNKDIKSVENLTKMNSWVPITIKVDVNYPLLDVEAVLSELLPRVAADCSEIISGPYYKGVLRVEMGGAVLSIIAECNEDDYYQVERTMVREILIGLRDKNVPVK